MTASAAQLLEHLLARRDLAEDDAAALLGVLADETTAPAFSGAALAALRVKGETAAEVRGFARAMRSLATRVPLPKDLAAVDVVGTGGDASGSLNLSTGAALLAAACGVPVVKHGNRSVSSRSGSADVLQALGLRLAATPAEALADLAACNFAFLFAPHFHPAMKVIAPVRRALGARTVFNILGPLTNPAAPPFQFIGAYDLHTAALLAETLAGLGGQRAFVVHGEPGWDEATPAGTYTLFDVTPGQIRREVRNPIDLGIPRCTAEALRGGDAAENARALSAVLRGEDHGPHRDALLLGAGLALELTGSVPDLSAGLARARAIIDSGAAGEFLRRLHRSAGSPS